MAIDLSFRCRGIYIVLEEARLSGSFYGKLRRREGGGKEGMRRGVGESDDRPCFTERLQSSGGNSVEAATVRGGGKVVPGEFGQPA